MLISSSPFKFSWLFFFSLQSKTFIFDFKPTFKGSFTVLKTASLISVEAVSFMEVLVSAVFHGIGFLITLSERIAFVAFSCVLAVGGSLMGSIFGAMNGQRKGFGFLNGARIGAITGAFVAIQLLEFAAERPSLSKVDLLASLVNGNAFVEYWMVESLYREISDIKDSESEGLSKDCVQRLPVFEFHSCRSKNETQSNGFRCPICLEDLEDGDIARSLPDCEHFFHLECIDKWLHLRGSCPTCRKIIPADDSAQYLASRFRF